MVDLYKVKILISGITGTVGEAFTKYLLSEGVGIICGIDRDENKVSQFIKKFPQVEVIAGDFNDFIFTNSGVDLVIHLAAMKHIDLCEANPNACVMNNVIKTYNLFQKATANGTQMLFMSTDKAVEPTSMYGFSKALAEGMAREYGGAFIRSGNVVASNGSVLGVWDEAIKKDLPIKITHPDMKRFFISADSLAEQAWELYCKGKIEIIPKMDREVSLLQLAEEKLNSYGYTILNYPPGIEIIGLRPGEKLRERLRW